MYETTIENDFSFFVEADYLTTFDDNINPKYSNFGLGVGFGYDFTVEAPWVFEFQLGGKYMMCFSSIDTNVEKGAFSFGGFARFVLGHSIGEHWALGIVAGAQADFTENLKDLSMKVPAFFIVKGFVRYTF